MEQQKKLKTSRGTYSSPNLFIFTGQKGPKKSGGTVPLINHVMEPRHRLAYINRIGTYTVRRYLYIIMGLFMSKLLGKNSDTSSYQACNYHGMVS